MIKAKLVLWPAQKDQTRHGRSEIIEGERVVVCETIEDPWRCCAALWTPKNGRSVSPLVPDSPSTPESSQDPGQISRIT